MPCLTFLPHNFTPAVNSRWAMRPSGVMEFRLYY